MSADKPSPARFRDPYLQWTRTTAFSGHAAFRAGATASVPLLLKLKDQSSIAAVQGAGVSIAPAWLRPVIPDLRYFTAWAQEAALLHLQEGAEAMAMSLPLPPAPAPQGELLREAWVASDEPLVVGVIDKHCAFLNSAFRRSLHGTGAARTRLLGLWEQGRPAEPAHAGPQRWRAPADFSYGRELTAYEIDTLLPGLVSGQDELEAYRALGYLQDAGGNLARETHGTHVLDIAAGLIASGALRASAKPAQDDDASGAALLFVDVPEPGEGDSTGASADAYILDALHYILRRAGNAGRVVVNLSVGALAGPHDGHSPIDQAIEELMERHPQLVVTVAAGNSAQERWHATGRLSSAPEEARAELVWRTIADDATDSFMELWFTASYESAFDRLKVTLSAPDGSSTLTTRIGDAPAVLAGSHGPQASLDFQLQPPGADGQARALALVALAPACGLRAGQPGGAWRVTLDDEKPGEPITLHAWLQRDTPGRPLEPVQQSFIDALSGPVRISGDDAVSSLASGQRTVVVGAARAGDGTRSPYSPSKVKVYAAADEDAASPGLITTGALSGSFFRMSGTSAAAPVVARLLAGLALPGEKKGPPTAQDWPALAAGLGPVLRPR